MQDQEYARRRRPADDSGVALLVALAVVAILSVVILDFSFSVRVDMHIAANFRDRLVALEAAKAGANYGIYMLRQDEPMLDSLRDEWAQVAGIVLDRTDPVKVAEQSNLKEDELGLYKHEDFLARQKQGDVPTASIAICDEERKINVNLMAGREARPISREWVRTLLENLEYPDVDPSELVDNIADWIDEDDDGYAEHLYYENLPRPYSCRNGQMESISELKLVKGMTDLMFFGDTPYPMQLSGLEEEEWEDREKLGYTLPDIAPWQREEDTGAVYGLINFLTAHSTGRVNLNTAPREVLLAILGNDDFLTDTVIDARQTNPQQTREISNIIRQVSPPLYATLVTGALTTFQSSFFRIESTGKFHKCAVKVTAVVSRQQARDVTVHYWRVEDVRPESSSQDAAWVNAM